jgi:hypothetical protein
MRTTQVVRHFRTLRPGWEIADQIHDGEIRHTFTIGKRDATQAVAGDPCQCTIARGCRRGTEAAEALILTTSAYLLEKVGPRSAIVVKYLHDGQNVVKNTDAGGWPVWNTLITLRPPSSQRRVGVQTVAQKARQPRVRKQSKAHIAKRVASAQSNPARRRVSRVGAAAA